MNPAIIETIKMLAGVANAERIQDRNKSIANEMLHSLLKMVEKDVAVASAQSLGIVTGQA